MAGQKIRIKLAAYDHELVDLAAQRIVDTMSKSGAKISGPIPLPTEKEVVTILRSPHKYKDSREQFEIRTHKRIIDIYTPNARLLDSVHLRGRRHQDQTVISYIIIYIGQPGK